MTDEQNSLAGQLADALRTIERQANLLEQLAAPQADSRFADDLRKILLLAATSMSIGSPSTHWAVLEAVVETAAGVLDAQAASLFLLDEEREELVFVVALGSKAEEVKQFRVPLGEGIAGYVAATGQPLAVADTDQDPRFLREIVEAVDYVPKTMLCVPLFLDDRVIGVLELLDKLDGMPFSTLDMEMLGSFASLSALTIEESRLTHDVRRLFRFLLEDVVGGDGDSVEEAARRFADGAADVVENTNALLLAGLVNQISSQGEAASLLAIEVLTAVKQYVSASNPGGGRGEYA